MTKRIDILSFVALDEIDHICLENTYHLAPYRGGDKACRLLHEAAGASHGAGRTPPVPPPAVPREPR